MPSPTSSLSTLRPDLAGSFMEFDLAMDQLGYIGHMVYPTFRVGKKSGTFGKIPVEQLLQQPDTERAPGSAYNRGKWNFETETFACKERGWEEPVDDDEASIYAEFFEAEQVAAARARAFVLGAAERRIAAEVFSTSNYTAVSVTNEWDDATNATPIGDVETEVQAIYGRSGLWPNAIVMDRKVFRNLRNTDEVKDRLASSGAGDSNVAGRVTAAQIAELFDLEMCIVAGGAKNTADEGQAASISSIWDDEYVWVGRVAKTNDIKEPCVGRTFYWDETGGDIEAPIESYRSEERRSEIIRARHDVDEKTLYTACAGLLDNITS